MPMKHLAGRPSSEIPRAPTGEQAYPNWMPTWPSEPSWSVPPLLSVAGASSSSVSGRSGGATVGRSGGATVSVSVNVMAGGVDGSGSGSSESQLKTKKAMTRAMTKAPRQLFVESFLLDLPTSFPVRFGGVLRLLGADRDCMGSGRQSVEPSSDDEDPLYPGRARPRLHTGAHPDARHSRAASASSLKRRVLSPSRWALPQAAHKVLALW